MEEQRPPIPAEIRRKVLVEAGHRCAIPTCRYIQVEIHHIIPWEHCKEHNYENLIALCPNCHARADKGEIDRKSLRLYKDNLRYALASY
jgi:5-methylcytosine-specific restriction endonuclease McrA